LGRTSFSISRRTPTQIATRANIPDVQAEQLVEVTSEMLWPRVAQLLRNVAARPAAVPKHGEGPNYSQAGH
jgi:hypothetical protein